MFYLNETEKELELSERFQKALKNHPEAFPKLGEPILTGGGKGFRIIGAENEEQLLNIVAFWWPTENRKLVPYFNGYDFFKVYRKWHE